MPVCNFAPLRLLFPTKPFYETLCVDPDYANSARSRRAGVPVCKIAPLRLLSPQSLSTKCFMGTPDDNFTSAGLGSIPEKTYKTKNRTFLYGFCFGDSYGGTHVAASAQTPLRADGQVCPSAKSLRCASFPHKAFLRNALWGPQEVHGGNNRLNSYKISKRKDRRLSVFSFW